MRRSGSLPFLWLLNRRSGVVVLLLIFLLALRQLILSQMELEEVKQEQDDYLAANGAFGKKIKFPSSMKFENRSGLTAKSLSFFLNGKPLRILGGSIHYFRFPPEYWHSRLLALKASGLNTVTTYIAWNAHEPTQGTFNFSGMLNLAKFIETAHDLDLYVILRVGPYICAEWEWGGLPSWLLRDSKMKVRTSDPAYFVHVQRWFNKLLPIIRPYQFTRGGPVIAVQVENEYASFPNYDPHYIPKLTKIIIDGGIKEFLFVCDDKNGVMKNLSYGNLMRTVNFQHNAAKVLSELRDAQPNWPLFVTEYWTGWFNIWGGPNNDKGVPWLNSLDTEKFQQNTKELLNAGGHMNMYMFAGGTNFGFMNGGVILEKHRGKGDMTSPDTTSYDYDALVSEEGLLKPKFDVTRNLLRELLPQRKIPEPPPEPIMMSYDSAAISSFISLSDLLKATEGWMIQSKNPIPMENFPANGGRKLGQAYGYALYQAKVTGIPSIELGKLGNVRDRALVHLDGVYQETIFPPVSELSIKSNEGQHTISFLVENQGRVNWVSVNQPSHTFENQRKGIIGDIEGNGKVMTDWKIWPLEFDAPFLMKLEESSRKGSLVWHDNNPAEEITAPALLKAELTLGKSTLRRDTFVELQGFEKGILIVNGINLGRYWNSSGPQKRLFLPGVWLRSGSNEIIIFEEAKVGHLVSFHKTSGLVEAG